VTRSSKSDEAEEISVKVAILPEEPIPEPAAKDASVAEVASEAAVR